MYWPTMNKFGLIALVEQARSEDVILENTFGDLTFPDPTPSDFVSVTTFVNRISPS